MNTLNFWTEKLREKSSQLSLLESQLSELEARQEVAESEVAIRTKAQKYIQTAAELTQKQLEQQLSDIVTPAMAAVVTDKEPYTFRAIFQQRRGTTECDLKFERAGELVDPVSDAGLGTADIASIALKVAYLSISNNRPILITDEIGKNISKEYRSLFATLLNRISADLGIQLIMITHNDEMIEEAEEADNVITVSINNEISTVHQGGNS